MENQNFVGIPIFGAIKTDERITPDLIYCLYCKISQSGSTDGKNWYKDIDYKIPLDCIKGKEIKQCPACKIIYILTDPTI